MVWGVGSCIFGKSFLLGFEGIWIYFFESIFFFILGSFMFFLEKSNLVNFLSVLLFIILLSNKLKCDWVINDFKILLSLGIMGLYDWLVWELINLKIVEDKWVRS